MKSVLISLLKRRNSFRTHGVAGIGLPTGWGVGMDYTRRSYAWSGRERITYGVGVRGVGGELHTEVVRMEWQGEDFPLPPKNTS